jgi:hypothetical protein
MKKTLILIHRQKYGVAFFVIWQGSGFLQIFCVRGTSICFLSWKTIKEKKKEKKRKEEKNKKKLLLAPLSVRS